MISDLTYSQVYNALFSEQIERYVPDGLSISHPVVDLCKGRIVDCFLLYVTSRDYSKYSSPLARIIISPEEQTLIDYKRTKEQPFSVFEGVDYYSDESFHKDKTILKAAEKEFQESYMEIRKIAFKNTISSNDKKTIVRYIKLLKIVEHKHLQPFLFELGKPFFLWVKTVI